MSRLAHCFLAIGAASTLGFMFYAGEPEVPSWWLLFLPFAVWALLPFAATAWVASQLQSSGALAVAALASFLVSGLGIAALYSTFITHSDAQGGLVFLFLPVWQLIGLFPFWALARFAEKRSGLT